MKVYIVKYIVAVIFVLTYHALVKFNIIKREDYHSLFLILYFVSMGETLLKNDFVKVMLYVITNIVYVELVIYVFITKKSGPTSKDKK